MSDKKTLDSFSVIRFPDCDPFNHLNNARYIDYMINAREDHVLKHYHFNIYEFARDTGLSWVVSQNQIAYLKPAVLMETVLIESTVLKWSVKDILVEMKMWNKEKTQLKAILWTRFTHFNLRTGRSETHSKELNEMFAGSENPLPAEIPFEERVHQLKTQK